MDPRAETAPRSLRRTALEMAFLVALSLGLTVPALAQSQGVWEPPFQWPMVAVHLLHHTSGDILSWAYDGPSAHLWDPGTGIFTPVSNNNTNIFCSCHAAMKEGLYMVAGGAFVNSAQVFDNLSIDPGIWLTKQDMNFTRFYPTCTTLGNTPGTDCSAVSPRSFIDAGSTIFTASSSRSIKQNLAPVQIANILDKISQVEVYNYDFINGPKDKIGLMAEDFHTVFGRGSDKEINGQEVEMALWLAVQELTGRIAELEARLSAERSCEP
jgi:hypothetical protein